MYVCVCIHPKNRLHILYTEYNFLLYELEYEYEPDRFCEIHPIILISKAEASQCKKKWKYTIFYFNAAAINTLDWWLFTCMDTWPASTPVSDVRFCHSIKPWMKEWWTLKH